LDRNSHGVSAACHQKTGSTLALRDLAPLASPCAGGHQVLKLKKIADVMKMSADTIEGHFKEADGEPSPEAANLVKELRELSREILTSQEFLNSKIKL
jgi:hypothetical protein